MYASMRSDVTSILMEYHWNGSLHDSLLYTIRSIDDESKELNKNHGNTLQNVYCLHHSVHNPSIKQTGFVCCGSV